MICFASHKPALLIGHDTQVLDYGMDWIERAILKASRAAGQDSFPYSQDVTAGINDFLEHHCSLRLLPLADLFRKVQSTLVRLGQKEVARQLTVAAPPVELSLMEIVKAQEPVQELLFFQELRTQVQMLRFAGADTITFTDLKEAVLLLNSTKRWTKGCAQTQLQIEDYLR